ncbi:MAG: acetate--CoA ligase family protein [Bacteroidetes bacterium]|nr:acetate--CoA ligase family protein [Bacteroidota bacterium]
MYLQIQNFFYPHSICIAGASIKEKSIGYEILKTIQSFGYTGKIYPVNPHSSEILGLTCYPSIAEVKDSIDLAIVVVPKKFVEETIDALIGKDVKSIILITAGFKEIGKEGEELEKRIVEKIKKSGARLVGPNCMGVINSLEEIKLNATFVAEKPAVGKTAFLSQSGALGAAVLNSLRETDIKFAHFISVGNKADINENDLIEFWEWDANIDTIALYLESFVSGENLIEKIIRGKVTKPLIVLKAGKSSAGMKAASSHTGALSGSDKVVESVLKQFGIIRANNLNELFNTAKGFEFFSKANGKRIAIITNAGGPGILAVDKLESEGLELSTFTEETKKKLKEIVHPDGSVENPVDLLPGADAEIFRKTAMIAAADINTDAVISIFVQPVMVQPFEIVEAVSGIESPKPIYQVYMPLPEFWNKHRCESSNEIPLFRNPEDPAEVISNILMFQTSSKKIKQNRIKYLERLERKNSQSYNFISGFLTQEQVNIIAADYNLPVVANRIVDINQLMNLHDVKFPVVLKGLSGDVIHKSEMEAVKLNIPSREQLSSAAEEMSSQFSKNNFQLDSFLIQPYIKVKHEILIGGYRDPSFGPVIVFGAGGKYVEVINDTALRSAYLIEDDIDEMIESTIMGKILKGVRGEKPCDIDKLKSIIASAAAMMIECNQTAEFDINPLIVAEDNSFHAVDIRIKFK